MWARCGVSNTIILARLNFLESGHIKVDQMRKQYDFGIKGAKVFAACNQISRQTDWPAPAANLFLQWWVADGT
jgi:hypothetical protein